MNKFIPLLTISILLFVPTRGAAQGNENFRFGWLTDTHVGTQTGATHLRMAVSLLNNRRDLDFVIVTGDVTEMGSDSQLEEAHRILDSLRIPVYVLPGNHDTKWSESGTTKFPRLWGRDRFIFEHKGISFVGMHEGPRMRMGDGHWAPEDLRWLERTLATSGDKPLIFLTHYPIDSSIDNWYKVLDRLTGKRVQCALVGHGHRNHRLDFEGIPALMASALVSDRGAAYSVVEVGKDSIKVAENLIETGGERWWASIPRTTNAFTGGAGPRPDFSMNSTWPQVQSVWTNRDSSTIGVRPALVARMVIVGNSSGSIKGLDVSTGETRWAYSTSGPVYSSPDAVENDVVMGSADGNIYCLSPKTGSKVWSVTTGGAVVASPAIFENVVYCGSSDRKMRAIELSSGKVLWTSEKAGAFFEARPFVSAHMVVVGAWDGNLYAFDRQSGKTLWTWHGDMPGQLYSPAACWPVGVRGKIFIVAPDRAMTCLKAATGEEIWRTRRYQVRETIGMSSDSSLVLVRTMRDSLVALRADADTVDQVWATNCGFGYDINSSAIASWRGVVYYGTKNGVILALQEKDGTLLWRHRMGVALVNTLLPLNNGDLLATDMDGVTALFRVKGDR